MNTLALTGGRRTLSLNTSSTFWPCLLTRNVLPPATMVIAGSKPGVEPWSLNVKTRAAGSLNEQTSTSLGGLIVPWQPAALGGPPSAATALTAGDGAPSAATARAEPVVIARPATATQRTA